METATAQRLMASLELLDQCCPNCKAPYSDRTVAAAKEKGPLENEFEKYGKTIEEVLSHRGEADDMDLDANIGFILLDKEQRKGLASFSQAERYVYAVQGMSREVNNGGFEQYFSNNSGALAFDLVPALKAMGSSENLTIAKQALARFGEPASLSSVDRDAHLSKITRNGEVKLWDDLDSAFYKNPEDIETMVLNYAQKNRGNFHS
jgi:hypothetical protein